MAKEELKPIDVSKYTVTESGNVIKDNLKQEAEEWLCNNLHSASEEDFIKAMVDIAESREKRIAELEAQIEKLIDFVLSKTECCDVCPMTDICINSEGTCPYVGILAKGEEEVTREWLMQFISKEIKENEL